MSASHMSTNIHAESLAWAVLRVVRTHSVIAQPPLQPSELESFDLQLVTLALNLVLTNFFMINELCVDCFDWNTICKFPSSNPFRLPEQEALMNLLEAL